MFPRLLCLLCLLALFQQASLAQQSGVARPDPVPDTCPVTRPPTKPFVPPPPYPARTAPGDFLYGTNQLWTSLRTTGTWKGLPHYTPTDPSFRQKLAWWRQGWDWHKEPQPKLKVTGRRLDSPAPPLAAGRANGGWEPEHPDQPFMVVGINLPALGCWEITGHYGNQELTFVVWVAQ